MFGVPVLTRLELIQAMISSPKCKPVSNSVLFYQTVGTLLLCEQSIYLQEKSIFALKKCTPRSSHYTDVAPSTSCTYVLDHVWCLLETRRISRFSLGLCSLVGCSEFLLRAAVRTLFFIMAFLVAFFFFGIA